jgi:pimeloyl-ACP methyl ester carboxylesterase
MGVISFAGGKGAKPDGNWRKNCHPENLAAAMKAYGAATPVPSLWIYAQNDLWIPPDYASLLHASYNDGAKGKATLVMTPPFGADGHYLVLQKEGAEIWRRPVADFLDKLEGKTAP